MSQNIKIAMLTALLAAFSQIYFLRWIFLLNIRCFLLVTPNFLLVARYFLLITCYFLLATRLTFLKSAFIDFL